MASGKDYHLPDWAAQNPPSSTFSLEILKDGTIIGEVSLQDKDKSYFVLGRQQEAVDILIEHPSISRQHAVLQYRNDGALMILDWNSAQGTCVNKELLAKDTYRRLYVGDIIKFAASTRSYIVNGPDEHMKPEYDSENMQEYRKSLALKTIEAASKKEEEYNEGVSWGFGEDAFPTTEEEQADDDNEDKDVPAYIKFDKHYDRKYSESFKANVEDSDVSDKDIKLLEKIRAKEKKIQNMQEENRRIYMKEAGQQDGLTSGQTAAVDRNDKQIEKLTAEIDELIAQLEMKKGQRESALGSVAQAECRRKKSAEAEMREEDDILDTCDANIDLSTNWRLRRKLDKKGGASSVLQSKIFAQTIAASATTTGNGGRGALSYEDFLKLHTELSRRIVDVKAALVEEQMKKEHDRNSIVSSSVHGLDDIDDMLTQERNRESTAQVAQLQSQAKALEAEVMEVEKLIRLTRPALASLAKRAEIGTGVGPHINADHGCIDKEKSGDSTAERISNSDDSSNVLENSNLASHQEDMHDIREEAKAVGTSSAQSETVALSSTKTTASRRCVSISMSAALKLCSTYDNDVKQTRDTESLSEEAPTAGKRKTMQGPGQDSDSVAELSAKKIKGPVCPESISSRRQCESGGDWAEKESVWVPPSGQSGDGKTWLNAKLGY